MQRAVLPESLAANLIRKLTRKVVRTRAVTLASRLMVASGTVVSGIAASAIGATPEEPSPAIAILRMPAEGWVFEVLDVPEAWCRTLAANPPSDDVWRQGFTVTSIDEAGAPSPVAMLGDHSVLGPEDRDREALGDACLRFRPRFPAVAGLEYDVRVDFGTLLGEPDLAVEARTRIAVPEWDEPPPAIVAVDPIGEVPANLLRIYLHFQTPMARGEAYRHLSLMRLGDGSTVEAPFLELPEELWDADRTRLTLLFDPGRLKRGLSPHEALGPPLREGETYLLSVSPGWRDAHGRSLGAYHFPFRAVAEDRTAPRIDQWRIVAPAAGSRQPLVLDFGEVLDSALATRAIEVTGPDGSRIDGQVSIENDGRSWFLTPDRAWPSGGYRIIADGVLEDLAGNSLRGVFDRDLATGEEESESRVFTRDFEIP